MKAWLKYVQWEDNPGDPPLLQESWFASSGNARNPKPHVRLTSPACENCGDCNFWMPYEPGDVAPPLPEDIFAEGYHHA